MILSTFLIPSPIWLLLSEQLLVAICLLAGIFTLVSMWVFGPGYESALTGAVAAYSQCEAV